MTARRVPDGPAPEPVVQRLHVRYAKRGRMRFTSSRDFQRALERALRLADVPMAFSAGFHPHPRVSYANAAPTGVASEAELVELAVTERVDPGRVAVALDAALPDGLDVLEVVEARPGPLAERLEGSRWVLAFRGLPAADLEALVSRFLARDRAEVTRTMKRGPRVLDVRRPVLGTRCRDDGAGGSTLEVTVRHTTPTVRPEEIWRALEAEAPAEVPRPVSTRLAQGPLSPDGSVGDPLTG